METRKILKKGKLTNSEDKNLIHNIELFNFQEGECPADMTAASCGKAIEINTVTLINYDFQHIQ